MFLSALDHWFGTYLSILLPECCQLTEHRVHVRSLFSVNIVTKYIITLSVTDIGLYSPDRHHDEVRHVGMGIKK